VGHGFAFIALGHRVLKVCKTTAWFKYGVGDGFAFIALGHRILRRVNQVSYLNTGWERDLLL